MSAPRERPTPMPATPFAALRPEEFRLYEARHRGDETLNDKRLAVRRKLQAVGEALQAALAEEGLALERRESLHHPFGVNHHRVVAQWTSLFRDAKARRAFARAVGPDLGKDVDPGHANLSFFVSVDESGVQMGLQLGVEAWYDAQNLVNRCLRDDGARRELAERLRAAPGFALRIHDWETRYPTDRIGRDELDALFKYYRVGEHRLACARAIPKEDPRATSPELAAEACAALRSLAAAYRFIAWSPENDHLMRAGGGFR